MVKCASCGADNSPQAKRCVYCGSHLPGGGGRASLFARVEASPEFADRNSPERHARLPKHTGLQKAIVYVFFAVFIGGSFFMCLVVVGMSGLFGMLGMRMGRGPGAGMSLLPLLFGLIPLGFVALGAFLLITVRKKMQRIETAPVESLPVIVVDKRTHVSGGGNSSTRTHYYVTCEDQQGGRREYQVWDGTLYGRMAPGDAGILFLRAGYGLDFDRVARA